MKMKLHDITAYNWTESTEEIENYPLIQSHSGDSIFILSRESLINKEVQEMLGKLAKAIGREGESTAMLALEKGKILPYKRIIENNGIRYLVIFGMDPGQLALQIEGGKNRVIKLGQRSLLFTHSASDLLKNNKAKAELWQALQIMYHLKK